MNIKIKYFGKIIKVDVSQKNCECFKCFYPHKYEHICRTIDGKPNNWINEHYSCGHRDHLGCPDYPKIKE